MHLRLIRIYGNAGTNGYLVANGQLICKTIELPWRSNLPSVSCIPEGKYTLRERYSPRFGRHLEVCNVPGRSYILFHPANDARRELRGCIAPVTTLTGPGTGTESRRAMRTLLDHLQVALDLKQHITLTIGD